MTSESNKGAPPGAPEPAEHPVGSRISGFSEVFLLFLGGLGMFFALNLVFMFPLGRLQPLGNGSIYFIVAVFLSAAFVTTPARDADRNRVPFYDWILVTLAFLSAGFFGFNGLRLVVEGWEFFAPTEANILAAIFLMLVLEGIRRAGGVLLFGTALIFGLYPVFAGQMPGFLWGSSFTLGETIRLHAIGTESVVGIPMNVVANIVIGFVAFGAVLTVTGGGPFFMRFSSALMGRKRGGPAKVAVVSSAIMGSLSGSVISNILTTGAITIPTMKKNGYPGNYAAAVESCASTGGTLMPPVMGAVAFIMASFLGISYAKVMVAAVLPAILFYLALLLQVDCFAARNGLGGIKGKALPRITETLREGWPYLLSLFALIWFLIVWRLERQAPYYASLIMIAACVVDPKRSFGLREIRALVIEIARSVGHLVAILAGIGLVVGGLSYTGVAGAFSRELLLLADGNIALMLIAGAVTSFVLGMGMTVSACYIFLSILLAPALVKSGLHPIASHLFILYWGMLSYITPPVALASITAANLANAAPMKSAFTSLRIGSVLFVLPFLFVLEPALILQGDLVTIAIATTSAIVAMAFLAGSFEGHLYWVGAVPKAVRFVMFVVAALLIYPEAFSDLVGMCLAVALYAVVSLIKIRGRTEIVGGEQKDGEKHSSPV